MNLQEKENKLYEWITESNSIVACTGAGISTDSGIPDFRSSKGLYTSGPYKGQNVESILSIQSLRKRNPLFFSFYKDRVLMICTKEPNSAHLSLTQLEECGKLKAVVTQNIDNLHNKAGTKTVLELHGNGDRFKCMSACGFECHHDGYLDLLNKNEIPKCPQCDGVVRPCTVLFGESLPDDVYDEAFYKIKEADLLLAIGSSLNVMPACSLVEERSEGCKFCIITKSETPYDESADLIINENCSEILQRIINKLKSYEESISEANG